MKFVRLSLLAVVCAATTPLKAADTVRTFIVEADPIAPSSAAYETQSSDVTTSKYGFGLDFNVGANVSMGPEIWSGAFNAKGPSDGSAAHSKENLYTGERQKIEAMRLRWMVGLWQQPQSMRGWYAKIGYSYQKINSRANRYDQVLADGAVISLSSPDSETDLITDTRHGVAFAFGNRWMFADQRLCLTAGASFTQNFKRVVTVDSHDSLAQKDYEDFISNLPDTKLALRPAPELNIGLGYAW